MKSIKNITLLEPDLRVIFTIPPRSKISPKYFTKITINKEMHQCLTSTAKVTFVIFCYLISKEPTFCVQNILVNLKLKLSPSFCSRLGPDALPVESEYKVLEIF